MINYEASYMFIDSNFVKDLVIHRHFDRTIKGSARPYYNNNFKSFSNIHLTVEPGFGQGRKLMNTYFTAEDKKMMYSAVSSFGNNFRDIRMAKPQKEKFPCEINFLNNSYLFTRLFQMPNHSKNYR